MNSSGGGWVGRLSQMVRRLTQGGLGGERRRHERYDVAAPLEVRAGDRIWSCRIENVSAGGLRLVPAIEVAVGESVTLSHPTTTLALDGRIVGHDPEGGTRVQFASDGAGAIVSAWVRTLDSTEGRG